MIKKNLNNPLKSYKGNILKVLIVDDHPLTMLGYEQVLNDACKKMMLTDLFIEKADTLEIAHQILVDGRQYFDVVLLDIRLKPYPKESLFSGEDLGKMIRNLYPDTKLIILTSIVDNYRINGIISLLNPNAFLIKTEVNQKSLVEAIELIIVDKPYYSPSVLKLIKNQYLSGIQMSIEEKKFLHLLSIGVPSKEIPDHLPWSSSKVEKEKRILRERMGVEGSSVFQLVHKAKDLGFI